MTGSDRNAEPGEGNDAGFTLVEALAAVALLSLLSVLLLPIVHFGLKTWQHTESHADRVDQVMLAQAFLRRQIEDAYPYFRAVEPTRGQIEFEGTESTAHFLASAPQALGGSGRVRISVSAERRGEALDLVVAVTPELAKDMTAATRKVLLRNVRSVRLSYFGKRRGMRTPGWGQGWTGETALPLLVRIEVAFAAGDRRLWPELVVAPRIDADVGCIYDPLTRRCRGR